MIGRRFFRWFDNQPDKVTEDAFPDRPPSFPNGAVVRLKSGGPNMTVDTYVGGKLHLLWYADGCYVVREASIGLVGCGFD